MSGAFRLALRNLLRNRRRTAATALATAVGFAGMVVLGGYAIRIETFLRTNSVYLQRLGHLTVHRAGAAEKAVVRPSKYGLAPDEQARIRERLAARPEVDFVAASLSTMGLAGNGCRTVPYQAVGVEPEVEARILGHDEVRAHSPELARPLAGTTLAAPGEVHGPVLLAAGLARRLGKPLVHGEVAAGAAPAELDCASKDAAAAIAADANVQLAGLTADGSMNAVDAEIVGRFHAPLAELEDSTLVAPLALLQELHGTDAVTSLSVFLRDHRRARALAPELERELRAAGLEVEVRAFDDPKQNPYYVGTMGLLGSLVSVIGLLVVTVVALSVLNAMTISILERTREIGTFRSLGFTRGQVLGLFVREAVILALVGVGAGAGAGLLVAAAVNAAGIRFSPPGIPGTIQLLVTPTPALLAVLAAVLVPLAAVAAAVAVRGRVRRSPTQLLGSHVA